jgi:hypothetical protein
MPGGRDRPEPGERRPQEGGRLALRTVEISNPVNNQAVVTFTATAPYVFFGNAAMGLGVNSTNLTATNLTAEIGRRKGKNIPRFGPIDLVIGGDKSAPDGTFSLTLTNHDPKVTRAHQAGVVVANGNGFSAAGHTRILGNGNTGFAGGGVVTERAAPEAPAVGLFGVGAAGPAGCAWRRRKAVA